MAFLLKKGKCKGQVVFSLFLRVLRIFVSQEEDLYTELYFRSIEVESEVFLREAEMLWLALHMEQAQREVTSTAEDGWLFEDEHGLSPKERV